MRRLGILFLVLMLSLVFTAAPVVAGEGAPQWGCPDKFELHHAHHEGEHDHEGHHHHHIGSDEDKNEDGWICVKQVGKDGKNHVHIDNNKPL